MSIVEIIPIQKNRVQNLIVETISTILIKTNKITKITLFSLFVR